MRSDAEDTGTSNTKVSDSGYSCSNSQSQRSTESSNSRNSTSSGSSGYGGHNTNAEDGSTKKKEHKKKKSKSGGTTGSSMGGDTAAAAAAVLAVAVVSPTDNNGCTTSPTAPSVITPSVVVVETAPSSVTVAPAQISETLTETQSGRHPSQVQQENGHSMNVDALHIAALSHTLSSLKKMKTRESADDSDCTPPSQYIADVDPDEIAYLLKYDQTHEVGIRDSQRRKGDAVLKIVVSISDGTVVFTSGLTQVLGYPKDMWLGRSLIDFIQPKHRATFAGSITSAIADFKPSCPPSNKNVFYCCLRKYRGLKTLGFSVIDKRITYLPCQFILSFKEFPSLGETRSLKECLVITAIPVRSAYNHPEDKRISTKFMTRHSATCQLIHVDHEVVSYFGYLPQDMLNRSILDFYHPQDLHFLKKVYEAVVKEPGHPFRSKPCRFRCQNGGYSLVETEMSAFNNPWSMKLEFVIGQHCVLKGPLDPDVVTPCEQDSLQLSDDIIKDTKMIQKEIIGLLNETLVKTPETAKQQVSKRCKDLAVFMEHLMDEIIKPPDLKVVVPTEEQSFSERDSVMLGTISPHHDYYDSKSSSETPPSYNQLNYNENILRFFESQPKTNMCEDSGESKNGSGGEEGKISPVDISSSMSKSGGSGVSSGQSTESTGNSGETTSNNNVSNVTLSYKPHALTEHLLSRHNEDMEKQMVQKHREQRCKSERDSKTKDRLKPYDKSVDITPETHGIKRSGSHSWEGDVNYKSIKASHANASGTANAINGFMKGAGLLSTTICGINAAITTTANAAAASTAAAAVKTEAQGCGGGLLSPPQTTPVAPSPLDASKAPPNAQPNPSLWPPFSVSLTPVQSSAQEYSAPAIASSLMPMYYLTDNPRLSTDTTNASAAFRANRNPTGLTAPYLQQQVQYMPSMLYHPVVFGPTSMMYSPLTAVYPSGFQHASGAESRPTVQQAPVQLRERTMAADKKPSEVEGDSNGTSVGFDDSSYHSSFYSFLKTDKSDESMRSSSENGKPEDPAWRSQGSRPVLKPVRKEAPWVEALKVTPHLMFKYQMKERSSEQVLKEDMDALKQIIQPSLVNDQLSQMYHDLELGGLSKQQSLEEGVTSSSESSGEESMPGNCSQEASGSMKQRRFMEYDKMTILFEEDAPMPPPLPTACT